VDKHFILANVPTRIIQNFLELNYLKTVLGMIQLATQSFHIIWPLAEFNYL